jgi:hypothetical protein
MGHSLLILGLALVAVLQQLQIDWLRRDLERRGK